MKDFLFHLSQEYVNLKKIILVVLNEILNKNVRFDIELIER
jgi:hypothetical protein